MYYRMQRIAISSKMEQSKFDRAIKRDLPPTGGRDSPGPPQSGRYNSTNRRIINTLFTQFSPLFNPYTCAALTSNRYRRNFPPSTLDRRPP